MTNPVVERRSFFYKNKFIISIVVFALIIRLAYIFFVPQFPLLKDDLQYNAIAGNLLGGKGFSYDSVNPTAARGPVYPAFLAAIYFLFGQNRSVARSVQAVVVSINCLLVYLIGREIFNHAIGLFAALIMSIYPSTIGYSGLLYSETLSACLLSASILLFIVSIKKVKFGLFVVSGVFLGLTVLCYPKFILLPFVFVLFRLWNNNLSRKYILFGGFILGALLTLSFWTVRNFIVFKRIIPVSTGVGTSLWYSALPEDYTEWYFEKEPLKSEMIKLYPVLQGPAEQHDFLFSVNTNEIFAQKAMMNIKNNPGLFVWLSAKRFFRQWLASNTNSIYVLKYSNSDYLRSGNYAIFSVKLFLILMHIYVVAFGCLGILVDIGLKLKNIFSPVLLTILYSGFINSLFITQPRYQIPVFGLLLIYTAFGSSWALDRLTKKRDSFGISHSKNESFKRCLTVGKADTV